MEVEAFVAPLLGVDAVGAALEPFPPFPPDAFLLTCYQHGSGLICLGHIFKHLVPSELAITSGRMSRAQEGEAYANSRGPLRI